MKNKLLKRLNNEITIWSNLYGDWYNMLYNEDGSQSIEFLNDNHAYKSMNECLLVIKVLSNIKKNRFYNIKKLEELKYKISE